MPRGLKLALLAITLPVWIIPGMLYLCAYMALDIIEDIKKEKARKP